MVRSGKKGEVKVKNEAQSSSSSSSAASRRGVAIPMPMQEALDARNVLRLNQLASMSRGGMPASADSDDELFEKTTSATPASTAPDAPAASSSSSSSQFGVSGSRDTLNRQLHHSGSFGQHEDEVDEDGTITISLTRRGDEHYPPKDIRPVDPLQVPYGNPCDLDPTARQRPFTDPRGALKDRRLMFTQFPSDFKMRAKQDRRPDQSGEKVDLMGPEGGGGGGGAGGNGGGMLEPGKIGKVQILKSGKARIVLDDGRTYLLNKGLQASFQEFVSAVHCKTDMDMQAARAAADRAAALDAGEEVPKAEPAQESVPEAEPVVKQEKEEATAPSGRRSRSGSRSASASAPLVRVKKEGESSSSSSSSSGGVKIGVPGSGGVRIGVPGSGGVRIGVPIGELVAERSSSSSSSSSSAPATDKREGTLFILDQVKEGERYVAIREDL